MFFWSTVLDVLWSKGIWKPMMIVWSLVLYSSLDNLVFFYFIYFFFAGLEAGEILVSLSPSSSLLHNMILKNMAINFLFWFRMTLHGVCRSQKRRCSVRPIHHVIMHSTNSNTFANWCWSTFLSAFYWTQVQALPCLFSPCSCWILLNMLDMSKLLGEFLISYCMGFAKLIHGFL